MSNRDNLSSTLILWIVSGIVLQNISHIVSLENHSIQLDMYLVIFSGKINTPQREIETFGWCLSDV